MSLVLKLLGKTIWLVLPMGLLVSLLYGGYAEAHGKEVNIAVACVVPDPARPLTQVCTAFLKYLDGDPGSNAHLELGAVRESSPALSLPPVKFRPLEQEGLYTATVTFPAYGRWRVKFTVRGADSGEAELVQELLPPTPGTSSEIRARLQIVSAFGFTDLRNIAIRVMHLLGAISWFALSALTFVFSKLPGPEQRRHLLHRLAAVFPWVAATTLVVLGVTGALSARYNAPTRSPGLFAPEVFASLPFGEAYLVTFLVKMALATVMLGTTAVLAVALRRTYASRVPVIAGGAVAASFMPDGGINRITGLAVINIILGLLVFANVVLMGYLHIVSHVAAALGG